MTKKVRRRCNPAKFAKPNQRRVWSDHNARNHNAPSDHDVTNARREQNVRSAVIDQTAAIGRCVPNLALAIAAAAMSKRFVVANDIARKKVLLSNAAAEQVALIAARVVPTPAQVGQTVVPAVLIHEPVALIPARHVLTADRSVLPRASIPAVKSHLRVQCPVAKSE